MDSNSILLFVTSHADLGGTGNKTGFWYEELAAPYYVFKDAGFTPVFVTPKGGRPPIDPGSEGADFRTESVERFAADAQAQAALDNTVTADAAPADFAAVFLVGGHGTMWDFPEWSGLADVLDRAVSGAKPVGAVCHGVAGLLGYRADGRLPLVDKKSLTGFTNREEATVGLTEVVPFLLQSKLEEGGASFSDGGVFAEHVVVDGLLVTGQNPVSSHKAAKSLLALLGKG